MSTPKGISNESVDGVGDSKALNLASGVVISVVDVDVGGEA